MKDSIVWFSMKVGFGVMVGIAIGETVINWVIDYADGRINPKDELEKAKKEVNKVINNFAENSNLD